MGLHSGIEGRLNDTMSYQVSFSDSGLIRYEAVKSCACLAPAIVSAAEILLLKVAYG